MAQFGKAAESDGTKTSPETVQAVFAANWLNSGEQPIVAGGEVTGTSSLAYHVNAGVGLVGTAAGAIYVVWPSQDTGLTTAPASGTATDTVFVDADGVIRISRQEPPAGVCILDKRAIASGARNTNSTTSSYDKKYAIPRGEGAIKLAEVVDEATSGWAASQRILWSETSFYVYQPMDLRVHVEYNLTIRNNPGPHSPSTNNPIGSCAFELFLDDTKIEEREVEYNRISQIRSFDYYLESVRQGRHTVKVYRRHVWGEEGSHHSGGKGRLAVYRDGLVS